MVLKFCWNQNNSPCSGDIIDLRKNKIPNHVKRLGGGGGEGFFLIFIIIYSIFISTRYNNICCFLLWAFDEIELWQSKEARVVVVLYCFSSKSNLPSHKLNKNNLIKYLQCIITLKGINTITTQQPYSLLCNPTIIYWNISIRHSRDWSSRYLSEAGVGSY